MRFPVACLVASFTVFAAAACSDDAPAPSAQPTAGAGGGGGGAAGNGGGASDVDTPEVADGAPESKLQGVVIVKQDNFDYPGSPGRRIAASFFDTSTTPAVGNRRCETLAREGDCVLEKCEVAAGTDPHDAISLRPSVDGGAIEVETSRGKQTATFDAAASKYIEPTLTSDFYGDRETVVVKSTGGVVPAFRTTFVAPGAIDITEPDDNTSRAIRRDAPLDVIWGGGQSGGGVYIRIDADLQGAVLSMTCSFDAKAGKGQVPVSMLSQVPARAPGASRKLLPLSLNHWEVRRLQVGDYQVEARFEHQYEVQYFAGFVD